MTDTIERKYALSKIKAGDYLLPSNDAQIIWRLRSYEDGPSHGIEDWPRDITLWGAWRWRGNVDALDTIDFEDADQWAHEGDGFTSRAGAIQWALSKT